MRKKTVSAFTKGLVTIAAMIALLQTLVSKSTIRIDNGTSLVVRHFNDIFGTATYLQTAYVWYLRVLLAAMILSAMLIWSSQKNSAFFVAAIAAAPTIYILVYRAGQFGSVFHGLDYDGWMMFIIPVAIMLLSLLVVVLKDSKKRSDINQAQKNAQHEQEWDTTVA